MPAENIYGIDVEPKFIDLGYDLFRDRETLASKFIVKDILDTAAELEGPEGQMDVIHINSFLHLFDWEGQVRSGKQLARLLKKVKGAVIVGRQLGSLEAGEFPLIGEGASFRHNIKSFEKLWRQIGDEVGCKWRVEAELDDADFLANCKGNVWSEPSMRMIGFSVFRE